MHEGSIVQALLDRVDEEVARLGATAVHRVHVSVGDGAGVDRELLALAWDALRAGSPCADAPLRIRSVAVRWTCLSCGTDRPPGAPLQCPECGDRPAQTAGGELTLDRVELEVPDV
jgi:hydrogenase nickel insertion protein HypA